MRSLFATLDNFRFAVVVEELAVVVMQHQTPTEPDRIKVEDADKTVMAPLEAQNATLVAR